MPPGSHTKSGKHRRSFDPIAVVQAGYRLGEDAQSWLDGVVRAVAGRFDAHGPMVGHLSSMIGASRSGGMRQNTVAVHVPSDVFATMFVRVAEAHDLETTKRVLELHRHRPISTKSELVEELPLWRGQIANVAQSVGLDLEDHLGFYVGDGLGQFMMVGTVSRREMRTAPRERRAWKPIAEHVGAGLRLRARLGALPPPSDPFHRPLAEAVLDSNGKLLAARGPATSRHARRALRDAVIGMEQVRRSGGVSNPDYALGLWQGLVCGRWSLIEHFESDARRVFVVYRNDANVPDPRALTQREQEVLRQYQAGRSGKQIALDLDLSKATVSHHLSRVVRKLGFDTLTELATLGRSIEALLLDGYSLPILAAQSHGQDPTARSPSVPISSPEPEMSGDVLNVLSTDPPRLTAQLTRSEQEIAHLLLNGLSRAAIAQRRGAAPGTIDSQINAIYRKLGVRSSQELALKGIS